MARLSRARRSAAILVAPAFVALFSCAEAPTTPEAPREAPEWQPAAQSAAVLEAPTVVISEIHYDNASTDVDEAIEVAGPAGTDLEGWQIVLYNGANGSVYNTRALSGVIEATCGSSGVLAFDYPVNGIQNGSPDGIALVDPSGSVVEFLSYEGAFTAAGGPADGLESTDIGVAQASSTPQGESLQRTGTAARAWAGPLAASFGACNDAAGGGDDGGDGGDDGDGGDGGTGGDDDYSTDPLFLSEIRADQDGADADEYFEVGGAAAASLTGITYVVIGDGAGGNRGVVEAAVRLSGALGESGAFVVAESSFSLGTADLVRSLNFENGDNTTHLLVRGFAGSDGQDLDSDDDGVLDATPWAGVADCLAIVDFVGEGPIYCDARLGHDLSFTPGHVVRTDDGWVSAAYNVDGFGDHPDTPGALDFDPATAVAGVIAPWGVGEPGVVTSVSVSASYVMLPVGYNRAIFANAADDFRNAVDAPLSWTPMTTAIVTVDEFGNLGAVGAGTGSVVVSAPNGVSATVTVEVVPDADSDVAYQDHTTFGVPSDDDPSDDIVVRRAEYALSFNPARGGANWVAWNLDGDHFGSVDRCECYTPDPALPPGAPQVVNFDYTGSGYSRGHLTMSVNRSATLPDNASTYLTTNILPQASANNGGPWLSFENYVNDRARGGEEAYVIAGGEYGPSPATLKDEGKVAIPDYTWKVAVFVARDATLASVTSAADLEVIAIRTPNRIEPGVRGSVQDEMVGSDWRSYRVLVDEIEAATGYDLLALLSDALEPQLESGFDVLAARLGVLAASDAVSLPVANALSAQLDQASKRLEKGDAGQAIQRLETFRRQLQVFERTGGIPTGAATELGGLAADVVEVLGLNQP